MLLWWTAGVAGFLAAVVTSGLSALRPHTVQLPLTQTAALTSYVRKTFGTGQRCLKVAADDTAEAAVMVAALHGWPDDANHTVAAAVGWTIELDESGHGPEPCAAYVVVGRRQTAVQQYMENFRDNGAERMLVVVAQISKHIKPYIEYSPAYFNHKDIILVSVYSQKETVYQMNLHHYKFVPIFKQQDEWFRHDIEGEKRVKNFHLTRIKVLAYNNSFFSSVIKNNETGKLRLSYGVECSIFKEIAARLNVTWKVYTSDDVDKWGTVWSNDTVTGGALRWLAIKKVDVAFCSLWIENIRLHFVEMSRFWTLMCLKFLVPKPQQLREKWDLLFKPFPLSLWLLVFFSAILSTITIWVLARIQKKIGYDNINTFTSLPSTIYWIIGMMLLTNNPRTYRIGPIRHLINWWCMFMFIMSTSFSSVLYSYITSPEYTNVVLEVEDMVKANYHWGLMYPPPFSYILKMQNPVHRAFSEQFVMEHSSKDRIDRIKGGGKYAVLTKCLYEKHFMESENVPAALLNNMRTSRTCLNQFYLGIGFVKGSPYVRSANLVLQRITESGLVDYWLSRVTEVRISPATFKQVYETKPRKSGTPLPLSYRQFKVVMTVWTIGCALSVVVFAAELWYGTAGGTRQQQAFNRESPTHN